MTKTRKLAVALLSILVLLAGCGSSADDLRTTEIEFRRDLFGPTLTPAEDEAFEEEIHEAMRLDSGEIGDNVRQLIRDRFTEDGTFDLAIQLGINTEDVVSAALGDQAAHDRIEAQLLRVE